MCICAYPAETAELFILDVVIIEADLLLVFIVDRLQFFCYKEFADLFVIDLDVLLSVSLSYLEDEIILLEAETILFGGHFIDAIGMFVLDADDRRLILG